jgi:tRNA pseudouridine13 synthase
MKLKQQPSDFIVEELLGVDVLPAGPFRLYKIQKTGMDTATVIGHIARRLTISKDRIGVCGLKDKHAQTIQYISVPSDTTCIHIQEPRLTVTECGYIAQPLFRGAHKANSFCITIRGLRPKQVSSLSVCEPLHIPNYYDSQRFGSYIDGSFIGKAVLDNQFDTAVFLYLQPRKTDLGHIKAQKKSLIDFLQTHCTNKQSAVRNFASAVHTLSVPSDITDRVLRDMCQVFIQTHSFSQVYDCLPSFDKTMHLQAVQSYLWNCSVREVVKTYKKIYSVPYCCGNMLFSQSYTQFDTNLTLKQFTEIVTQLSTQLGITPTADFDWNRPIFSIVSDYSCDDALPDSCAKRPDQFVSVTVRFVLPTGCYATVVLKQLLHQ